MLRWGLMALVVVSLAACKGSDQSPAGSQADVAGPNVGVSAAPGLSMTYEYGFRLPTERIAATQEDNAAQCEAMGPTVCRVTGMNYDVGRDRSVTAALLLKLAPEAARHFGKQSIDTVAHHGGMLVHAQIASEDSGAAAAAAQSQATSMEGDRARIERQLAQPGLKSGEREQLQSQLASLSDAVRSAQWTRQDAVAKLASTPMALNYQSGDVDSSLSDGPIIGAVKDGWSNVISGIAVIVMLVITLLPWLVCAGLAVWAWARVRRRIHRTGHRHDDV